MGVLTVLPDQTNLADNDNGTVVTSGSNFPAGSGAQVIASFANASIVIPTAAQVRSTQFTWVDTAYQNIDTFGIRVNDNSGTGAEQRTLPPPTNVLPVAGSTTKATAASGAAWTVALLNSAQLWLAFYAATSGASSRSIGTARMIVTYNEAPTVSVPANATFATNRPTLSWTYADPEGDAQERFRVKVINATDFTSANNYDAEAIAAVYDSGWLSSNAASFVIPTDLANGNYRYFVWVSDAGSNGRSSVVPSPASSFGGNFTISVIGPNAPVVADLIVDQTQGKITVPVTTALNLIDAESAGAFSSGVGSWSAVSNAVISAISGAGGYNNKLLKIAPQAAGDTLISLPSGVNGVAVLPNEAYTLTMSDQQVVAPQFQLSVIWSNSAGATVGTSTSAIYSANSGGNSGVAVAVNSPSGAAFAQITVKHIGFTSTNVSNGQYAAITRIGLAPGAASQWSPGGMRPTAALVVERSIDGGVTYAAFRSFGREAAAVSGYTRLTSFAIPLSGRITVYDFEAPIGKAVTYRARLTGTALGIAVASPNTVKGTATLNVPETWRIKSHSNPDLNIYGLQVEGPTFTTTSDEDQTVNYPLGRDYAVVVSGRIHGESYSLPLLFANRSDADRFELLRRTQAPLYVENREEQMWIRLGAKRTRTRGPASWRRYNIDAIQVDAPVVS